MTVGAKPREAESWDGREAESSCSVMSLQKQPKGNWAMAASGPSVTNVLG